jgi:putative oxidoreductase
LGSDDSIASACRSICDLPHPLEQEKLMRGAQTGTASPWVILIRLSVGLIFLSEGLQKFVFPEALGVGRFVKIGIPAPHLLAPFVGVVEIVGGALLVLGLLTRLASVPLLIDMVVALATTKLPMLHRQGFWAAAHESRVDFALLLSLLFLLITGAGRWSLDAKLPAGLSRR